MLLLLTFLINLTGVISTDEVFTGPDVCFFVNTNAILSCDYSTSGDAIITWFKGDTIATGDRIIIHRSSGTYPEPSFDRHWVVAPATLSINNTEFNDTGLYWCELSGFGVARTEDDISLSVLEPHTVDLKSPVQESGEHESVIVNITCIYSGANVTSIIWKKDGNTLQITERFSLNDDGSILKILNTTREDTGNYSCLVSNCAGSHTSLPSELVVKHRPFNVGSRITQYSCPRSVECYADGFPKPQFFWPATQSASSKTEIGRRQRYYCIAWNDYGNVTSSTELMSYCLTVVEEIILYICIVVLAAAIVTIIVVFVYCAKNGIELLPKDRIFVIGISFLIIISIPILLKFIKKKKQKNTEPAGVNKINTGQ